MYPMKTLYLECNTGAAGDMLNAALFELLSDAQKADYLQLMNSLGLPGVTVSAEPAQKCGILGTHMQVLIDGGEEESLDAGHEHEHDHEHADEGHHDEDHHDEDHHEYDHDHPDEDHHEHEHDHVDEDHHDHDHEHHHHAGMQEIADHISAMPLPEDVISDILEVYNLLAEAESHVHGIPVDEIHFHEVGSLDAMADIAGFCVEIAMLDPDRIICSPVCTGSGEVHCAHGILPVPTPATAYLLQGIPSYTGSLQLELCTPTGAALLKYFVEEFGPMPVMKVAVTGYGCGKKDLPQANCVRAMLGEQTVPQTAAGDLTGGPEEDDNTVLELCCNLDDMTPEEIAFACERLMDAGALDVYTTAIGMKKNRPGILLTCMCRPEDREIMTEQLFRHTTTLGLREYRCRREVLEREEAEAESFLGTVRVKHAEGYGVVREKFEYEDLASIAKERDMTLREVRRQLGGDHLENT